jgi:hypothetical protein
LQGKVYVCQHAVDGNATEVLRVASLSTNKTMTNAVTTWRTMDRMMIHSGTTSSIPSNHTLQRYTRK